MITGAILDFDGTIFDSMHVWNKAGERYLFGKGRMPAPGLKERLKALSLFQSACCLKEDYELADSPQEIMAEINALVEEEYFFTVQPKVGVADFLEGLRLRGVRMLIATATERYQVEAALKRCQLSHFFQDILTCTQLGTSKTEPLIFQEGARRLESRIPGTLVVEDALHAVQTAVAAGFPTLAVYDAFETRQEKLQELADLYLHSYNNLQPVWTYLSKIQEEK